MEMVYPAKVFWMCAQGVGPQEHGDVQETVTVRGKGETAYWEAGMECIEAGGVNKRVMCLGRE